MGTKHVVAAFLIGALTGCAGTPSDVECSPPDLDDIKCPTGKGCLNFTCYPVCETSADCAVTDACINSLCQAYSAECGDDAACVAGFYCLNGACVKSNIDGSACTRDAACTSESCVDGRCCNGACDGVCMGCATEVTGEVHGACAPVKAGLAAADCAGACDGAGSCIAKELGESCSGALECSSGACVDGVCCDRPCDGVCQTCAGDTPGTCVAASLGSDPDNECPDFGCGPDRCLTGLLMGQTCEADGQCDSGFCTDGVCCHERCDGTCVDCGGDTPGVCELFNRHRDPAGECDRGLTCSGADSCHNDLSEDCLNNADCESDQCTEGQCVPVALTTTLVTWSSGAESETRAPDVAITSAGDVVVVGSYDGTINIGGVTGSESTAFDVYVAKFNPSLSLLWLKTFGGPGADIGEGVEIDSNDNIIIAGRINDTLTFGGAELTAQGTDVFVAKLDPSGNPQWATSYGAAGTDTFGHLAIDSSNGVYVSSTLPGAVTINNVTYNAADTPTVAIAAFNNNGSNRWFDTMPGYTLPYLAADTEGAFVASTVTAASTWGGASVVPQGEADIVLARVDEDGVGAVIRHYGGSGRATVSDVVRLSGGIGLAGVARGTVAQLGLTAAGSSSFIARVADDGEVNWARSFVPSDDPLASQPMTIAWDTAGHAWTAGFYNGAFGAPGLDIAPGTDFDGFLATVGPDGAFVYGIGFTSTDIVLPETAAAGEDTYVVGQFGGSATVAGYQRESTGTEGFLLRFERQR